MEILRRCQEDCNPRKDHSKLDTSVHAQLLNRVWLCDPMNCVLQTPLPRGFLRQECWSGLLFPSWADLPYPGVEPTSTALASRFFSIWATWEALELDLTKYIRHTSQSKLTIPSMVSSEMPLLSPCHLHGSGVHLVLLSGTSSSVMVQGVIRNYPRSILHS